MIAKVNQPLNSLGTYAKAVLNDQSKDRISYLTQLLNIHNAVSPRSLHATITYSRETVEGLDSMPFTTPVIATPIEFDLFKCEDEKCLVIKLHSDQLHDLHNQARALGATYDYPEYHPHITVSYDYKGDMPSNDNLSLLGPLEFSEMIVVNLIDG